MPLLHIHVIQKLNRFSISHRGGIEHIYMTISTEFVVTYRFYKSKMAACRHIELQKSLTRDF